MTEIFMFLLVKENCSTVKNTKSLDEICFHEGFGDEGFG
jgi:hypothetical protein